MWKWFRKQRESADQPLTGSPSHRRLKTYTAGSGYVYEYYYEGYRVAQRGEWTGAEHVFSVSADRKRWFPVPVFLPDNATAEWERENGRDLDSTERYAIVKMSLFQAFDDRDHPSEMEGDVLIDPKDIPEILTQLGLD
jgi:hypothetical protein